VLLLEFQSGGTIHVPVAVREIVFVAAYATRGAYPIETSDAMRTRAMDFDIVIFIEFYY
jgi:hypothetical protein